MSLHHNGSNSGIYAITHIASGRAYIGSAQCIKCRWNLHRRQLRHGKHHNRFLQRAWTKYGKSAFSFSVLEHCDPSVLIEREQWHINQARAFDKAHGYNLRSLAGSRAGHGHSAASIAKIRAAKSVISEETRKRLSESHLGHRQTAQTRRKISDHSAKAKLSREIADEIRRRYGPPRGRHSRWAHIGKVTTTQLAAEYGVSAHAISVIVKGDSYGDIG